MKKVVIGAVAVVTGIASSAMAGVGGTLHTVYVFDFEFSQNDPLSPPTGLPDDPTINLGDTVRWILVSGRHTVTSVSGQSESFDSGLFFTPGAVMLTRTFTNLGDFEYYCQIHGVEHEGMAMGMAGVIHVVPAPGAAATLGLAGLAACRRRR